MRDGRHGGVVWWDSVVNSYVCRCGSFQPHTPNFVIGAAHRSMIWGDEGPFSPSCQSHSAPPFRLGTVYRSLRPPPPSVAVSAVSRASDRSILQVVYKAFDQEGKGRLPYAQVGGWVGTARQGLFMMMHGLGCVGGRCRAGFVCVCMYAWTHT